VSQTKKEGASRGDADVSPEEEALRGEVRAADEIQDVTERGHAIEAVTAKLAGESARHPTAWLFWLLGYAWYLHPDRMTSTPIQKRSEAALHSALDIAPTYALAHMYLGNNAFDLRNYAEARSHFDRVDLSQLGSYWAMKVREMRVSCTIAIDGLASALDQMDEFVHVAEQHPPPDVMPTVLYRLVKTARSQLDEAETERLQLILERLERAERFCK
jgi:hypothetical protein